MTTQQQIRELRNKILGEPKLEFGCEVEVFDRELSEQIFIEPIKHITQSRIKELEALVEEITVIL